MELSSPSQSEDVFIAGIFAHCYALIDLSSPILLLILSPTSGFSRVTYMHILLSLFFKSRQAVYFACTESAELILCICFQDARRYQNPE